MTRKLFLIVRHVARAILLSCVIAPVLLGADLAIQNNKGVKILAYQKDGPFALGSLSLDDKVVELPLEKGIIAFRNITNGQEVWLKALAVERVSDSKEVFSGSGTIGGSRVQFKVTVDVPADVKAVKLTYDFRSEKELPGRQAVLAYHSDFAHTWQCHIYPYAESSKYVERDPLSYMGIPSLFLYRDDRTMGLFWGIDMNFD